MAEGTATTAASPGGRRWRPWRSIRLVFERHSLGFFAFLLSLILLTMVLSNRIFITIPPGHVGVLWLRFFGGTVTDRYYDEGLHVIFPWDKIYIYDARLQNDARTYDTISSNGLSMQVEIAVRFRINRDAVGLLHKLVGPNYPEILVYPEVGSQARELIASYTPEQLYSQDRAFIQAQMLERLVTQLGSSLINQSVRGKLVNVEDVLIRSVKLPTRIQQAIESKAEQYQRMLEYDFRIAREKKEAERKKIEAEGIRAFEDTVGKSINEAYLRLRGIEATMALANSPNTKVIIIGGKGGLPLILNTGEALNSGTPSGPMSIPGAKAQASGDPSPIPSAPPNARLEEVSPPNAVVPVNEPPLTSDDRSKTATQKPEASGSGAFPSLPAIGIAAPSSSTPPLAPIKGGEASTPPAMPATAAPETEGPPARKTPPPRRPDLSQIFR